MKSQVADLPTDEQELVPIDSRRRGTALVGRQPILRHDKELFGYELLFRDGPASVIQSAGNVATANVLINSLFEIGLDQVAGNAKVFVNVTRDLLVGGDFSFLPPDRFVLEVLEDVPPDEDVLESIRNLKADGFTIALDDYFHQPNLKPLVDLADVVKIDLPMIAPKDRADQIRRLVGYEKLVLAEKVETHEEFELCRRAGCHLFQGYFFCKPQLIGQRKLNPSCQTLLRVLAELNDSDMSHDRLEELLSADASICYRLLRYVNSANLALMQQVSSIRHAATVVGLAKIRAIATIMLMSEMADDHPRELMSIAMIRAKTCENISRCVQLAHPQEAFIAGMVSTFDAFLDTPVSKIVELLPLSEALNSALLFRSGDLGKILSCVLDDDASLFPIAIVDQARIDATVWATQNTMELV